MKFAMWVYPWDLLDEGVETVADRLAELGIDELNLATNYHAVQPFLPHNPKRKTFFAHASAYFHPDKDRYGQLSPVPNETMGDDDWLARIADEIEETHLTLNSWTIGCHNSRLGMANPDLALESPFGDRLVFGLCPSQPETQAYLQGLLTDISSRAPFERIELETFDYFYGTGFGWHHDKYHLELGRLGEFLFGLCFCDACRENAVEAGIDVNTACENARNGVEAAIKEDLPRDTSPADWLRAHPELDAYVALRTTTLKDLYAKLRAATCEDAQLGRYAGFFDVEAAWIHGADLEALSDHLDYHTVIAYESTTAAAVRRVRTAKRLGAETPLHAGILPGHPAVSDAATVAEIVNAMAEENVERLSFYNYGLLPERNLKWIAQATASHP